MNKSPKIIFTVTNDLVHDQRMIRICSTMTELGYEVQLIGRKQKKSTPISSQPYEQTRFRLFFESGKLFYVEYNLRLLIFLLFRKFDAICSID